jgi:hypothetical protein
MDCSTISLLITGQLYRALMEAFGAACWMLTSAPFLMFGTAMVKLTLEPVSLTGAAAAADVVAVVERGDTDAWASMAAA